MASDDGNPDLNRQAARAFWAWTFATAAVVSTVGWLPLVDKREPKILQDYREKYEVTSPHKTTKPLHLRQRPTSAQNCVGQKPSL